MSKRSNRNLNKGYPRLKFLDNSTKSKSTTTVDNIETPATKSTTTVDNIEIPESDPTISMELSVTEEENLLSETDDEHQETSHVELPSKYTILSPVAFMCIA